MDGKNKQFQVIILNHTLQGITDRLFGCFETSKVLFINPIKINICFQKHMRAFNILIQPLYLQQRLNRKTKDIVAC